MNYFIGVFIKSTNEFESFVSFVRENHFVWDSCGTPLKWKKFDTAKKWADRINQAAPKLDCRVVEIKESLKGE